MSKSMEEKLNQFINTKNSPTGALLQPFKKEDEDIAVLKDQKIETETQIKGLSDLVQRKEKIEDTHTRRTFLVKNEFLERLDKLDEIIGTKGFKKDFINHVIEPGLKELEDIIYKK